MHPIHHTEAFVVELIPQGEANMTVVLFTKELGIISARAQGVRKPGAKLRAHLVQYAHVHVDLVRGRGLWRLVNARLLSHVILATKRAPHARAFVRVMELIRRLVPNEGEPLIAIFDHILECQSLIDEKRISNKYLDTLMLAKTVSLLGYGSEDTRSRMLLERPLFDASQLMNDDDNTLLIKNATDALHHSHL